MSAEAQDYYKKLAEQKDFKTLPGALGGHLIRLCAANETPGVHAPNIGIINAYAKTLNSTLSFVSHGVTDRIESKKARMSSVSTKNQTHNRNFFKYLLGNITNPPLTGRYIDMGMEAITKDEVSEKLHNHIGRLGNLVPIDEAINNAAFFVTTAWLSQGGSKPQRAVGYYTAVVPYQSAERSQHVDSLFVSDAAAILDATKWLELRSLK